VQRATLDLLGVAVHDPDLDPAPRGALATGRGTPDALALEYTGAHRNLDQELLRLPATLEQGHPGPDG
jgi:hypothetical protein